METNSEDTPKLRGLNDSGGRCKGQYILTGLRVVVVKSLATGLVDTWFAYL